MEHKHQKVMSSQPSQQVHIVVKLICCKLSVRQAQFCRYHPEKKCLGIIDLIPPQNLYEEDEEEAAPFSTTLSSSLGLNLPNPAPEIDMEAKNNPGKLLHSIDDL